MKNRNIAKHASEVDFDFDFEFDIDFFSAPVELFLLTDEKVQHRVYDAVFASIIKTSEHWK